LLADGLRQLELDPGLVAPLEQYLALLQKWNKVHNLVGTREAREVVSHHIFDCLAVVADLSAHKRIVDLGSGAGLPGLLLALALPESQIVLLERQGKRASFLRQAIMELSVGNATVASSADEAGTSGPFDAVIARAFGSLAQVLSATQGLRNDATRTYVMKGKVPHEEMQALAESRLDVVFHPVRVPGLAKERHLVVIGQ